MADAVVRTEQGNVRGFRDGRALAWLGIPYAAPPIGRSRFRAPSAPVGWAGVRDATRFGAACVQRLTSLTGGRSHLGPSLSEDCLFLNIWSPRTNAGRRPVMLWIHGGAFIGGSGALYRGGPLATLGDIVVVTINYRLGVLGFVNFGEALGEPHADSNLGLRDMIAALRWVKANIAGFGGDPEKVTLAGESAGSISTALLMLCDEATPLFHQAILQSGAVTLTHSREKSIRVAQVYRDHLRLNAGGLLALQRLPADRLLDAEIEVARRNRDTSPAAPWFDGTLLPANLDEARFKCTPDIPLLAGSNRDEVALFNLLPFRVLPNRRPALSRLVRRDLDPAAAAGVLRAYPDTNAVNDAFATDLNFAMPTLHFAERHAAHAPAWIYRFDYRHPVVGACHALELFFLWPFPGLLGAFLRGGFLTGRRSGLSERMRSAWTSFVRTGSPGEDWPRYTFPDRPTRLFALQDRIANDPMRVRREAWGGADTSSGR